MPILISCWLVRHFHYKDKGFGNFVLHHSAFIIIIIIAYKRQQESKQIKNSRGGRHRCSLKIDSFFSQDFSRA